MSQTTEPTCCNLGKTKCFYGCDHSEVSKHLYAGESALTVDYNSTKFLQTLKDRTNNFSSCYIPCRNIASNFAKSQSNLPS